MAKGRPPKGMPAGASIKTVNKDTVKRLMGYIFKDHKVQFIIVLICIIITALTGVASSLFLQTLIDDYIEPLLLETNPNLNGLLKAIIFMVGIYIVGILSSLIYTQMMVKVAQSTLKDIRDDMFEKMQRLPIKYFDTHTHGDLMSRYTNLDR